MLLGPHLVWAEDWRRRLFRNIPDIVAVGDAFDVGHVVPRRCPTVRCPLAEPIRHYRAVCPGNYFVKLRSVVPRSEAWAEELRLAEEARLLAGESADEFWRELAARLELATRDRVPAGIDRLVGTWSYSLDESLAKLAPAAPAS